MGADDCGYDLIYDWSDEKLMEFYQGGINYAKKCLKESKLEKALSTVELLTYYSSVLKERKINHKSINYEVYEMMKKNLCDIFYKNLEKEDD